MRPATYALILLFSILALYVAFSSEQSSGTAGVTRRPNSRRRGGGRRGQSGNGGGGSGQRGSRRGGNGQGGSRRGGGGGGRGRCEEIHLPMCKGLVRYSHTRLPNRFNHTTQLEVYQHLEHLWSFMDHYCSENLRLLACGLYLPKCGRQGPIEPCKRTCMAAKRKCSRHLNNVFNVNWQETFSCTDLPRRRCIKPVRDTRCPHRHHPNCVENSAFPICANLTFVWGTLPNMFQQCHTNLINQELEQYQPLIETRCHPDINFFLCGVFSPFCIRNELPFTFPCRELCEEVRGACEPQYRRLYHNLPWPNKLQCHRYPATTTTTPGFQCVMPHEGSIFGSNTTK